MHILIDILFFFFDNMERCLLAVVAHPGLDEVLAAFSLVDEAVLSLNMAAEILWVLLPPSIFKQPMFLSRLYVCLRLRLSLKPCTMVYAPPPTL